MGKSMALAFVTRVCPLIRKGLIYRGAGLGLPVYRGLIFNMCSYPLLVRTSNKFKGLNPIKKISVIPNARNKC